LSRLNETGTTAFVIHCRIHYTQQEYQGSVRENIMAQTDAARPTKRIRIKPLILLTRDACPEGSYYRSASVQKVKLRINLRAVQVTQKQYYQTASKDP
jgi:hypothetical protein